MQDIWCGCLCVFVSTLFHFSTLFRGAPNDGLYCIVMCPLQALPNKLRFRKCIRFTSSVFFEAISFHSLWADLFAVLGGFYIHFPVQVLPFQLVAASSSSSGPKLCAQIKALPHVVILLSWSSNKRRTYNWECHCFRFQSASSTRTLCRPRKKRILEVNAPTP